MEDASPVTLILRFCSFFFQIKSVGEHEDDISITHRTYCLLYYRLIPQLFFSLLIPFYSVPPLNLGMLLLLLLFVDKSLFKPFRICPLDGNRSESFREKSLSPVECFSPEKQPRVGAINGRLRVEKGAPSGEPRNGNFHQRALHSLLPRKKRGCGKREEANLHTHVSPRSGLLSRAKSINDLSHSKNGEKRGKKFYRLKSQLFGVFSPPNLIRNRGGMVKDSSPSPLEYPFKE